MEAMGATTAIANLSEMYLAPSQRVADGRDTGPPVVNATGTEIRRKDRPRVDHRLCHHRSGFLHRLDQAGQAAALAAGEGSDRLAARATQKGEKNAYAVMKDEGIVVNLTRTLPHSRRPQG